MARNNDSWEKIFDDYAIHSHNFDQSPFTITAKQIKQSVQEFTTTSEKEVRILCKQDTREHRPEVFIEKGLFILPIKNGVYKIIQGEGYVDLPVRTGEILDYKSTLDFKLETSMAGNSEMQHLDVAYASSLIRTFTNDPTLVLTIRGRKWTPAFSFYVGKHEIETLSIQTEVDAGYEGKEKVVLIEAKNSGDKNVVIRQLFYPYRQWQEHTNKPVHTIFFEKDKKGIYSLWEFEFKDPTNYNSIHLIKSSSFRIT